MRCTLIQLAGLLAAAHTAHAAIVEHWWNITWVDGNPDGVG